MRAALEKQALTVHLALTFVSSWTLWLVSGVLGHGGSLPPLDRGWLIAQIGVFCPSLWAIVLAAVLRDDLRRACLLLLGGLFLPATLLGGLVAGQGAVRPDVLGLPTRILVVAGGAVALGAVLLPRRLLLAERRPFGWKTLRWSLAAALQLPSFFLLAWLFVNLAGGDFVVGVLADGFFGSLPALAVLLAFDMIFGGALGEEIGWRAFALPRLLARRSPLGASLILGVVWSLWHLPIDLAAGFGTTGFGGILFRLLFTCSLSVIVTWYFIHSGHGLLAAFLIHATLNWLPVLEFARYEIAMGLLLVMMLLFAARILYGDRRFREVPDAGAAHLANPGQ